MLDASRFWKPLRKSLEFAKRRSWWELAVVMLGLPILEGILTEIWASAPEGTGAPAGWALLVLAITHVVIGVLVLAGQSAAPQSVIADAVELEEGFEKQSSELKRREITYRLVRKAFDRLTLQTCTIEEKALDHTLHGHGTSETPWCLGGFCQGFMPVLKPFMDQIDVALGVKSMQFTLEAWFHDHVVSVEGAAESPKNGLTQHIYYGPHVDRCVSVCLDPNCSPCCLGALVDGAYEQHIRNNEQLFYEGHELKTDVYFRRFAVCPITWACSEDRIGTLVLTSMQDEPFADDVLDTMAFLATLIGNYHAAYEQCYNEYHAMVAERRKAEETPHDD